ncbi:MAG: hypothetical protein WC841_00855 [Candidatus Shapirobacteria bacterium]|jgi:hypothetical protein
MAFEISSGGLDHSDRKPLEVDIKQDLNPSEGVVAWGGGGKGKVTTPDEIFRKTQEGKANFNEEQEKKLDRTLGGIGNAIAKGSSEFPASTNRRRSR